MKKIAKKVYLSFLNTYNKKQQNYLTYVRQKVNSLNSLFKNNQLKNNLSQITIIINPSHCIKEATNKNIDVNIILFYVDKVDKKDYIHGVMNPVFQQGTGEALEYNNKQYIVVYGSSDKNKNCYNERYFKQTVIHELMHVLDKEIEEDYNSKYFFGNPVEGCQDNYGVPYPGMYGNDDDLFESQFAEYFTCKGERKQYIYDLLQSIENYAIKTNQDELEIVEELKDSLDDKMLFFDLVDKFEKKNINFAPLAFVYHLTFSKQKNGNKQTILDILNNLY